MRGRCGVRTIEPCKSRVPRLVLCALEVRSYYSPTDPRAGSTKIETVGSCIAIAISGLLGPFPVNPADVGGKYFDLHIWSSVEVTPPTDLWLSSLDYPTFFLLRRPSGRKFDGCSPNLNALGKLWQYHGLVCLLRARRLLTAGRIAQFCVASYGHYQSCNTIALDDVNVSIPDRIKQGKEQITD